MKESRNAMRVFMFAAMPFFAWRHGWDHGFVLFLLGFYGGSGSALYTLFVHPLLPVELNLVTGGRGSRKYLNVEALSNKAYELRIGSDQPLGIT